jgi:uncharacterized membrane protein HdeD (DUF308 family)
MGFEIQIESVLVTGILTSGGSNAPHASKTLVGTRFAWPCSRAVWAAYFFVPGISLVRLVLLFGVYALADGIFNVIAFFRVASHHWALLIEGLIGIVAGILTFAWPAITAIVLLYVIAFWAIFTGIFEIIAGIRLRKAITNEWLLLLMGVLSLVFGMLILVAPSVGALAIVLWIGAYAFVFGVFLLALAFRLRGHRQQIVQRA